MKTTEEAAKEYAGCGNDKTYDCGHCPLFSRQYECEYYQKKDAFESGVEFAQHWISVEEELPKIESGEAYSEIFLLKCNIFKYVKIWACVRNVYGEFIVVGMTNEILYPHYKPTEWRPIELK